MLPSGLALDSLSLVLLLAYGLSIGVALAPAPSGTVRERERSSRRALFAPPALALLAVGLGFWPGLRSLLTGLPDHCGDLADPHPHLCWLHASLFAPSGAAHDAFALVTVAMLLAVAIYHAFLWGQALGRLRLLVAAADPAREPAARALLESGDLRWDGPLSVVAFGAPLCFVHGLRRPHLVISTAVLESLSADDARAILAHEVAHVRRRDNLWRLVGQAALLWHVPGLGRRAFGRWSFCAEAACDEEAAATVGSRIAVAEALVRYQRLLNRTGPAFALGAAFGGAGQLATRVSLLLDPPAGSRWTRWRPWWPALALSVIALQPDAVHTFLEDLLELLHG